jgi:hypothetical protein
MTLSTELIYALLSLDSYNRGYNAGINVGGNALGSAQILQTTLDGITVNLDSGVITDSVTGERLDDDIGFYAIAYSYSGETIISFRGTDNQPTLSNPLPDDVFHGWSLGTGNINSEQAQMAVRFYQEVAGDGNWRTADISLTGHSLGGGLAGY